MVKIGGSKLQLSLIIIIIIIIIIIVIIITISALFIALTFENYERCFLWNFD